MSVRFCQIFFCICWDNQIVFLFLVIDVIDYINWFLNVEPVLHTWEKSHLVIVHNILYSVGFDLLIFCWILHLRLWAILVYSFLSMPLSGFGINTHFWTDNVFYIKAYLKHYILQWNIKNFSPSSEKNLNVTLTTLPYIILC